MLAEYMYNENDAEENISSETFDTDCLKQYMKEITRYELLSNEELENLFDRIKKGDKEAHDIVVEHNLRLVVKYARSIKKSYHAAESVMDLIQAGNIGLMRAVDKFVYEKGFAFSTYASWWIKQSIIRHIYDNENAIRVPVHMSEKFISVAKVIRQFKEETGKDPSFDEITKLSNITAKEYNIFKTLDRNVVSMNATVGDDGEAEVGDFIPSSVSSDPVYDEANHDMLASTINQVLDKLDDRERYIVKARYGLDGHKAMTLEEIGREMKITRERVRQIEIVAMRKLKTSVKAESLRAYR